jgi:hypothetical protein
VNRDLSSILIRWLSNRVGEIAAGMSPDLPVGRFSVSILLPAGQCRIDSTACIHLGGISSVKLELWWRRELCNRAAWGTTVGSSKEVGQT